MKLDKIKSLPEMAVIVQNAQAEAEKLVAMHVINEQKSRAQMFERHAVSFFKRVFPGCLESINERVLGTESVGQFQFAGSTQLIGEKCPAEVPDLVAAVIESVLSPAATEVIGKFRDGKGYHPAVGDVWQKYVSVSGCLDVRTQSDKDALPTSMSAALDVASSAARKVAREYVLLEQEQRTRHLENRAMDFFKRVFPDCIGDFVGRMMCEPMQSQCHFSGHSQLIGEKCPPEVPAMVATMIESALSPNAIDVSGDIYETDDWQTIRTYVRVSGQMIVS